MKYQDKKKTLAGKMFNSMKKINIQRSGSEKPSITKLNEGKPQGGFSTQMKDGDVDWDHYKKLRESKIKKGLAT